MTEAVEQWEQGQLPTISAWTTRIVAFGGLPASTWESPVKIQAVEKPLSLFIRPTVIEKGHFPPPLVGLQHEGRLVVGP